MTAPDAPRQVELREEVSGGFLLKTYRVAVAGFSAQTYHARSRGKALASAWRDFCSYRDDVDFKAFMGMARCWAEAPDDRFGEAMTVGGQPAFYVGHNRQYIKFVRPGCDVIMNTHPLDVDPPEARRGTPYATAIRARAPQPGDPK